ncbi:MAG: glycoside hydrolase family 3 N-terminal domain-containing protein [Bacilli bacterium]
MKLLKEKIAQMLCFSFKGNTYNKQLKTLVEKIKVGGIVYFKHNIDSNEQVLELNNIMQEKAKIPLFICVDQEGGYVRRLTSINHLPGAMALAASRTTKTYDLCLKTGKDLKSLGFNINFAPVGDVNNNPYNPVINARSYSDNFNVVKEYATAAFKGFQDAGLLATIKHFPGHGNTNVDSHLGLPRVGLSREDVLKGEIIPFKEAIEQGIDGVMMSHIIYSSFDTYPASLSKNIVRDFLINELNFKGLIVTDSLTMQAISKNYLLEEVIYNSVMAGCDMLVFCGQAILEDQLNVFNTFVRLVEEGKIPVERIEESYRKIINLKGKYCNRVENKIKIDDALTKEVSTDAVTVVLDEILPLDETNKCLIISPKIKMSSLVDNNNPDNFKFSDYFNGEEIFIDEDLSNLDLVREKVLEYERIILITYNVSDEDYQTKIFKELDKKKTLVISLRSPYDVMYLEGVENYICLYEVSSYMLEACKNIIYGKNKAKGKLPVKIGGINENS